MADGGGPPATLPVCIQELVWKQFLWDGMFVKGMVALYPSLHGRARYDNNFMLVGFKQVRSPTKAFGLFYVGIFWG